jgi:serine/threonine protein kinase
MIGTTVSHYEIVQKLGEGGMGTVYKARDTRLDRYVALKVLAGQGVANPERRQRFIQEAKSASALNHPNIITVYDISSEGNLAYLAMEYVEGKTLAQIIAEGPLAVDQALGYAIQISGALASAHAAGIVHRDLKPANVMVTDKGLVKVLDFGLAKLIDAGLTDSEQTYSTASLHQGLTTDEGTILGTVAYMSPEQALGKRLDVRTDVFSFGAMLYEMLTGKRPFEGETKISTIAAIITQEPRRASELVPTLPRELERVISRCLRKDPGRRFQHMDDLRIALEEVLQDPTGSGSLPYENDDIATLGRERALPWWALVLCGLFLMAAGGIVTWFFARPRLISPGEQKVIPLTTYRGNELSPSFSPEGSQITFSWDGDDLRNQDIYVKLMEQGTPLRLTTHPARDERPAWSPDGRLIAFERENTVYVISPLGGPERLLIPEAEGKLSWLPDSSGLLYTHRPSENDAAAVWLFDISSGAKRRLTNPTPGGPGDLHPTVSPDGRELAFIRWSTAYHADLYLAPIQGGEPRRLTRDERGLYGVCWTPAGNELIFSSERGGDRSLWRILVRRLGPSEPERLTGVSDNSTAPAIALVTRTQLTRLAYQRTEEDLNIWRYQLEGEKTPAARFLSSTRMDAIPQYSPDGTRVAFVSDRSGHVELWTCDSEGSNLVQVTSVMGSSLGSPRWSPNGDQIAFDFQAASHSDVYVVSANGGPPKKLTSEPSHDARPAWSKDGKWIYFRSDRSGKMEIWRVPSIGGEAIQVTRDGGYEAQESLDGSVLYYTKDRAKPGLWSMPIQGAQETLVLEHVWQSFWALSDRGIYYLDFTGYSPPNAPASLKLYRLDTKQTVELAQTRKEVSRRTPSISVTADGRSLLLTVFDYRDTDLMLIENFQ